MRIGEHRISTLTSGVRVVSEPVPGVRSVALGFLIATGSASETDEQAGISHLLEHMLFRGTARYGSSEIDEIFDAMGAEINAGTDKEATSLYTRVLDRHLERALDVMSDMIWHPSFGELEAEREVVLEEIAMYEDDPQEKVFDLLGAAIFGSHPLGRPVIGEASVIAASTRDQLSSFHAGRYVPGDVVIAAAGSVDHDELVAMVQARDTESRQLTTAVNGSPPQDAPAAVRFERKDTEQYHVCLGGPGIGREDERRFALRLLDNVLGGSASSRLFQAIRERHGLAYAVFSFSNLYAKTGEVGMYLGTRPENLTQALGVLGEELERFGRDPATAEELDRSRENAKGRIALSLESTSARMSRLGSAVLGQMPILSVEEVIERVDAVTIEDLHELARELFDPTRLSVAAIGPQEDVLRDSLHSLQGTRA
ncbi:MAG TPA: pitrilysin family protein [Solirubrobacteraceae bacterium]|jgi:predicted Zn-dependent peptidase